MKTFLASLLLLFIIGCRSSADEPLTQEKKCTPIDSTIFNKTSKQEISYIEFRNLKLIFSPNDLNNRSLLNSYCEIDSLKKINAYKTYLENIDIGMMQDASLFSLSEPDIPKSGIKLLLLTFQSYEACPIYSGTVIIGYNEQDGHALTLAKEYFATDPPSSMKEHIQSQICNDSIVIDRKVVSDDMDLPGENIETQHFISRLSDWPALKASKKQIVNSETQPDTVK